MEIIDHIQVEIKFLPLRKKKWQRLGRAQKENNKQVPLILCNQVTLYKSTQMFIFKNLWGRLFCQIPSL